MRRSRTIYFNDARHYYLFVFEPPLHLQDAWRPIDEVAGTAVDTFIYGVSRGDGLFYPTKKGKRFGQGVREFDMSAYWRLWESMQSLIDRGLDPLQVLIDRAHEKGMDFFASFRMASYVATNPDGTNLSGEPGFGAPAEGGRGFANPGVRDAQFAVLEELATGYPVEGLELDFAAAADASAYFRPEEAEAGTAAMTEHVRRISEMIRHREGAPGQIGARVPPTEEICLRLGLDVRTWLQEGLLDYVTPMLYMYFQLDADMPIDWLVDAAHAADVSVYGMLQPYVYDGAPLSGDPLHGLDGGVKPFTPAVMRAAAATYRANGVDGLYTWFMNWPLGESERGMLAEMGDPDLIVERDKHYVLPRRSPEAVALGYDVTLPLEIPGADPTRRYPIPFTIADDVEGAAHRIRQVILRLRLSNMVSADRLSLVLNGRSLERETCLRDYGQFNLRRPGPHLVDPYRGQWLEFHLREVRPSRGRNVLEISLDQRPTKLAGKVTVDDVEVIVEYGSYPSKLSEEGNL